MVHRLLVVPSKCTCIRTGRSTLVWIDWLIDWLGLRFIWVGYRFSCSAHNWIVFSKIFLPLIENFISWHGLLSSPKLIAVKYSYTILNLPPFNKLMFVLVNQMGYQALLFFPQYWGENLRLKWVWSSYIVQVNCLFHDSDALASPKVKVKKGAQSFISCIGQMFKSLSQFKIWKMISFVFLKSHVINLVNGVQWLKSPTNFVEQFWASKEENSFENKMLLFKVFSSPTLLESGMHW